MDGWVGFVILLVSFFVYLLAAITLLFLAINRIVGYGRFIVFVVVAAVMWIGVSESPHPGWLAGPVLLLLPAPFFIGIRKRRSN